MLSSNKLVNKQMKERQLGSQGSINMIPLSQRQSVTPLECQHAFDALINYSVIGASPMTSLRMFGSGKFESLPFWVCVCVCVCMCLCVQTVFRGWNVVEQVITGAPFFERNKNPYVVFMVPLSLVILGAEDSLLVCAESATIISVGQPSFFGGPIDGCHDNCWLWGTLHITVLHSVYQPRQGGSQGKQLCWHVSILRRKSRPVLLTCNHINVAFQTSHLMFQNVHLASNPWLLYVKGDNRLMCETVCLCNARCSNFLFLFEVSFFFLAGQSAQPAPWTWQVFFLKSSQ